MSYPVKEKYIEPMAKGEKSEKSRHSRKRSDSGYGGTSTDRSSHRHSGSRRSNESANGMRVYAEEDVSMATQRFDVRALQNALQASNESNDRLDKENIDLDKGLTASHKENRRLRGERDEARKQNAELRASLTLAHKEIEQQQKELAKYQKESKKSSSKSKSKETWRDLPVPLYNNGEQSPPPEMPRNYRPTSNSRPTTTPRRMSMSHSPSGYTYTVQPANYNG